MHDCNAPDRNRTPCPQGVAVARWPHRIICTDTEYQIWDASDAPKLLKRTDLPKINGEPDWVGAAPASGDRMAFSVRSLEPAKARVGVLDLATGDRVRWPENVEGQIWSMTTSPSGQLVAWSECSRETGRFRLEVADTELDVPRV